jgi:hypothetical protein
MSIFGKRAQRMKWYGAVVLTGMLALLIALPAVAQEEAAPEEGSETPAPEEAESAPALENRVDGFFRSGFDGVWSDDGSDLDLNQSLGLDIRPGKTERVRLRGLVSLQEDLDGSTSDHGALRGINDSYESDLRARLLHLYVQVDELWGKSTLRVGRQRIMHGAAYNRIDGVYFSKKNPKWDWYAFAGLRASVYKDSHNDLAIGGGAAYRPGSTTRIALDTFYGEDHRENWDRVRVPAFSQTGTSYFPRKVDQDAHDNLIALSLWQDITPNLAAFARFTWNGDQGDELLVDFNGYVPAWDLAYEFRYRRQLDSIGERVNDLTGYYRVLGVYSEYDDYLFIVEKGFGKKLALSLEAEIHDAQHDQWFSGNRDYQRLALVASVEDLCPSVDAQVALERWRVKNGESTWALTGEVTKSWKRASLSIGMDYERYEDRISDYDNSFNTITQIAYTLAPASVPQWMGTPLFGGLWSVETHENIYSVYAKARVSLAKNQELTARIRYETDDRPEAPYWRFRAGYLVRF